MAKSSPKPLLEVIGLATLIVGTLDIADALIFYRFRGVPFIQVLQSIASGVLGAPAFRMGVHSAVLGIALHYFITLLIVTLYLLANRKLPLSHHPFLSGAVYGIVIYFLMNYVVIPLSLHYPPQNLSTGPFLNGIAASIFLVGIPTALINRRYQSHRTQNP